MAAGDLDETAVFLVLTLKQVLYGLDRLDAISDEVEAGSPAMAFYLASIYNYVAVLFLLDGKGKPMGGSAYPALDRHGLAHLLDPMKALLEEPLGSTTFGEVLRVFRNTAIAHSTHGDADLDRVYAAVDMGRAVNQARWQDLLHRLRGELEGLAPAVARATGRPLEDFGFSHL
jgi:hypothetical protein